jgi:dihydrofolate reductase
MTGSPITCERSSPELATRRRSEVGRVVVSEFISLDGVIEDPGGAEDFEHGGWTVKFDQGDEGGQFKLDETMAAEGLLLGRVTYEHFAAAWPSMTDEAGFADKMNGMPKYVVSSTLEDPEWNNSTVVNGDVAEEIPKLTDQVDGDLLVAGSSQLVQGLAQNDLVDEYRLMVFPIVLGTGKRLFGELSNPSTLRLSEAKPVGPDGIVVLTYSR